MTAYHVSWTFCIISGHSVSSHVTAYHVIWTFCVISGHSVSSHVTAYHVSWTFCIISGQSVSSHVTAYRVSGELDVLYHFWTFCIIDSCNKFGDFATAKPLSAVFPWFLCKNMRRGGYYAIICGFQENMRFNVENTKICDLMQKIEKYAISHVPHLNHVPGR